MVYLQLVFSIFYVYFYLLLVQVFKYTLKYLEHFIILKKYQNLKIIFNLIMQNVHSKLNSKPQYFHFRIFLQLQQKALKIISSYHLINLKFTIGYYYAPFIYLIKKYRFNCQKKYLRKYFLLREGKNDHRFSILMGPMTFFISCIARNQIFLHYLLKS